MSHYDPRNTYTPSLTPPQPWAGIEAFYVSLTKDAFDQQPMVELIRHIRSAYAENRFHAFTSMHTLVVSVNNPIEFNRDNLRIDYHFSDANWEFNYLSNPFKPAEFIRRYSASLGIEKFDNFVKMIGW
ncbi:hypothetical protein [Mesorhizobium amorphae]|uniref:Uncharacterized protein n=1 Tax=Mesorhizobium amorphae CCNWGS0123 TaxID=1082933 RepID=G6YEU9_9HYPH|nr:hypothetical protein [Mesorhizobium amorphae]ANT52570.1 hypothetical protein A6B35_23095 [Mesorhizobium amorphae CCNWGS0123]EHH09759.1 hypothetical protein MEA186_22471 [Mesorhizobium amorphae CCNWGS0123]GLR43690.1 hypothetical protein GCM10007880_42070 [Mesorhizobium amorphae]